MAKLTIRGHCLDASNDSNLRIIETIRSCIDEMSRVEEINLTGFSQSTMQKIFRDLPKSAPQLHTLCIDKGIDDFSFPEDFLYNTERLQRVELSFYTISWESQLLTGLTRLTLKGSLNANSSIIQVLHALKRMPALTELRLIDSIPAESGGACIYPVVDLPCLQILHIVSSIGPLTTFLRHITFPHSAILNLTCTVLGYTLESFTQINFSNFLFPLTTNFLSSLVIRSLQVSLRSATGYTGLEFYLWTTADCFPYPSSLFSQSQLQLFLMWPSSQRHNHGKVLTSAFDAMNLSFLTQLQLSSLNCIDSKTWVKTFGKLPLLERVYVKSSATHFLEALIYKTKEDEKSNAAYRNISFPKPRYIHLEFTNFFGTGAGYISVEKLLDYLMERCEREAEVRVLRLDNCYCISSHDVKRLKEIVVDVIWDGVEWLNVEPYEVSEDGMIH